MKSLATDTNPGKGRVTEATLNLRAARKSNHERAKHTNNRTILGKIYQLELMRNSTRDDDFGGLGVSSTLMCNLLSPSVQSLRPA